MNLLKAANRRTIKHPALGEDALVEGLGRHGEVLHGAGQVAEPHVNELHTFGLYEPQYLIATCEHQLSLAVQPEDPGHPPRTDAAARRNCYAIASRFPGRVPDVSLVLRDPADSCHAHLSMPNRDRPDLPNPTSGYRGPVTQVASNHQVEE